jgi:hypothetical protein
LAYLIGAILALAAGGMSAGVRFRATIYATLFYATLSIGFVLVVLPARVPGPVYRWWPA